VARIEPTFCIVAIDKLILDGLAPPDSAVVFEVLGCACCKARDSFVSLLKRIAVDGTFDYVFVEPTSEGIYSPLFQIIHHCFSAHPLHLVRCFFDKGVKGAFQVRLIQKVRSKPTRIAGHTGVGC